MTLFGISTFDRRDFLRSAAIALAATQLGLPDAVHAQPLFTPTSNGSDSSQQPGSFGPLKHIDAGELNVGYAEAGPSDGPVAILLHGWPYDIHSFVDVAPLLAANGYRVIVPHLRGYGTTTFRSSDTFRNGQPSVVALDIG